MMRDRTKSVTRRLLSVGAIAAWLIMIPACAVYTPVPKEFSHRSSKLRVSMPAGWIRYNPDRPACTVTRDGLALEQISLRVTRMGKEIPNTERVYRAGMAPHEIGELVLALMGAREEVNDLVVDRIEFAEIARQDGYAADAAYTTDAGLRKRVRICGSAVGEYVCEFRYDAADQVYFDRYRDVFEQVVASAHVE